MVVISSMIYIFSPSYLKPSDVFFYYLFPLESLRPLKTAVYIKDLRTITTLSFCLYFSTTSSKKIILV